MKQTPPTASQNPDKSRNVTGGHDMWAAMFPFINFIMFLLGWFTVPIEVLFRRDFGQRWMTLINFYAGLFVMLVFASFQSVANAFSSTSYYSRPNPYQQNPEQPSLYDRFMDKSLWLFILAYVLVSSYHFFRIWWRNGTKTALHSFDDGTSRFEPIAVYPMRLVSIAAIPVIRVYMLFLPKSERQRDIKIPPLMDDLTAFTNTIFEPFVLLVLAIIFHGATRIWLLCSFPALAIYANWKEISKLNKDLDFRDSVIDAEAMANYKYELEPTNMRELIMQQATTTIKNNPQVASQMKHKYPDVMSIIEELNSGKSHLADSPDSKEE